MSVLGGLGGAMLPPAIMQIIADAAGVKAGVGEATAEMGALETATTKFAGVGKVAMAGLAIGVAAVGAESVKLAANFDQTMELVHTQAMAPQSAVDALKGKVLDLAGVVGQSPGSLAEGLYHIASVLGPQVMSSAEGQAQAMDILTQSAKLASMGMANLDDVTYAMSGVMSVGMKDVKNAADGVAFMNATVGMGDMRMQDLAAAIGTGVLPAFKSAGLGMADFSAALATITDNSTPANEAATRLRMTIALMGAPSGPAVQALASIGIGATQLATDLTQPNGLLVAVQDLKAHLQGLSTEDANAIIEHAFGGGKTSGAIQTLLQETDKLAGKYDTLGTSEQRAATMDQAWQDQQKQFSQQWHELTATVEAYGVKIGNWLIPKIQDTVKWMQSHSEIVKILAVIIGGVLVAAMIAFTAQLIAMGVAAMANPVVWIIIAIIAAVALLAVGIYELVKHWNTVWNWIKRIAGDVWGWLVGAWRATVHGLEVAAMWVKTKIVDPIVRWFNEYLLTPIKLMLKGLQIEWEFAWGFLSVIIGDFVGYWQFVWGIISSAAKWAWDNIIKPVFDFIVDYGVHPVMFAVGLLVDGWNIAWDAMKIAASWAWDNVLKPVLGFIVTWGIEPIKLGIDLLKQGWDVAWQAMKDTVSTVWDFLKPIFDAIGGGIDKIGSVLGSIASNPMAAGQKAAHMLGFADGGVVPGPIGRPTLAVVHGGERILSNDELAAMGGSMFVTPGRGGGGDGGDIIIHVHTVRSDGSEIRTETFRAARRKRQSPEQYNAPASVAAYS